MCWDANSLPPTGPHSMPSSPSTRSLRCHRACLAAEVNSVVSFGHSPPPSQQQAATSSTTVTGRTLKSSRPEHLAAAMLQTRSHEAWSLSSLAAEVHISSSQLGRRFSKEFGVAPMKYLTQVRATRLATLLETSDRPIGELMRKVGWRSRGHAAQQFRRVTGVLPAAYRERWRRDRGTGPALSAFERRACCPRCGQEIEIATVLLIPITASL